MGKQLVVINEQHKLMPDQIRALNEKFGEGFWERLDAPADGWTAEQQISKLAMVGTFEGYVFASPIPFMLMEASKQAGQGGRSVWVFHNDNRDKKEVDDGKGGRKLISTVAATGWQILP